MKKGPVNPILLCVQVGGLGADGKIGLVSSGVRGGSLPGGLILYCCPDDLEPGTMETLLPWLGEVSWWCCDHVATKPSHLGTQRNGQRQKAGNNSRALSVPVEKEY